MIFCPLIFIFLLLCIILPCILYVIFSLFSCIHFLSYAPSFSLLCSSISSSKESSFSSMSHFSFLYDNSAR